MSGRALFAEHTHTDTHSSFWTAFCPYRDCNGTPDTLLIVLGAVVVVLMAGTIGSVLAVRRGRSPVAWFVLSGVTLGVAIAVLACCVKRIHPFGLRGWTRVPTSAEPEACAACGHANHPDARECAGCGSELAPGTASEAVRALKPKT